MMGEQESYGKYQDAKNELTDAITAMLKHGEELELSETEVADDMKEIIKEINEDLYVEF